MVKKLLVVGILVLLVCAGCSTIKTTYPLVYTHSPNTDFEILGTVFFISNTYVGYNTVFEEAKKKFPSTDFVIDIMIDHHELIKTYHWLLMGFKILFQGNAKIEPKHEYTIRGTAIKYIKNIHNIDFNPSIQEKYQNPQQSSLIQIPKNIDFPSGAKVGWPSDSVFYDCNLPLIKQPVGITSSYYYYSNSLLAIYMKDGNQKTVDELINTIHNNEKGTFKNGVYTLELSVPLALKSISINRSYLLKIELREEGAILSTGFKD